MQELNLSHNDLVGGEPMVVLLGAESLCELSLLNLSHNALGDDGAGALALHLHALPNLRAVILESNEISDDGVRALADSLPSVCLAFLFPSRLSCAAVAAQGVPPYLDLPAPPLSCDSAVATAPWMQLSSAFTYACCSRGSFGGCPFTVLGSVV